MKSWLAQGGLSRRVIFLPGTTFLHVNWALNYVQTDATIPNIVGPSMLGVAASVCL